MIWDRARMDGLLAKHAPSLNASRVWYQDGGSVGFGIVADWGKGKKRPMWVSKQRPDSMTNEEIDAAISAAIDKLKVRA